MTSEIKNSESAKVGRGQPVPPSDNPKSIIVRNAKLGLTRRACKSELKWFAERGFVPEVDRQPLASAEPPSAKPGSTVDSPRPSGSVLK